MDLLSSLNSARTKSYRSSQFSINSVVEKLASNFLYGNKYLVYFAPIGRDTQRIFDETILMMINNINLPTVTFNTTEFYSGGFSSNYVTSIEQGSLDFTMYNTGLEYDSIVSWGKTQYNPITKAYGFPDDTAIDIYVTEYNIVHSAILTHKFINSHLETYGGITLSYEESTQVQTFAVTVGYESYSASLGGI